MASKTNTTIKSKSGKEYGYVKIKRKVGMKRAPSGAWITDYKQFYGASKKEAEAKYNAYMEQRNKPFSRCFGDLLDSWIDNVFSTDSRYKDTTKSLYINAYKNNFKNSDLLGMDISDITGKALQEEYSSLTCGASTVRSLDKLLGLFFKYAEREGYCRDVTASLVLPPVKHKTDSQTIDVLSDDEIKTIIEGFPKDHRLRLLVILALRTGCRISELLALRYSDITKDGLSISKQLYISGSEYSIVPPKAKASVRTIPLNEDTLAELSAHKAWHQREMLKNGYRTDNIFTTSSGNYYHISTVRKSCNRVYKKIGVRPLGFHVYRHTFGSHLANTGTPIQTVSALMGHESIATTAKYYINVSNEVKKKAIAGIGF